MIAHDQQVHRQVWLQSKYARKDNLLGLRQFSKERGEQILPIPNILKQFGEQDIGSECKACVKKEYIKLLCFSFIYC